MVKLDKLDWKILEVLDWYGRMSFQSIAKLVHSNKDVVAYRIRRLEQEEIIIRYYPVLDMQKLGYYTSRLYFDLEEMTFEQEQELIHFLDKDINAGLIFRMDYPYKYGILFWTKDLFQVESIIQQIKKKLGKVLIQYNYSFFCSYYIYPKDYLFAKKYHKEKFVLEKQNIIACDKMDFNILKRLASNARLSTVNIAHDLKMPQTTVSAKIKQLENKLIILGYRAEINYFKLGYINYFLELYLENTSVLKNIEVWANAHKNVIWLQKIIGKCDIEIEVEVKDRVEFEKLLQELRVAFPSIRKIIFWSQEYKKFTFFVA